MDHKCKDHKWLMMGGFILLGVMMMLPRLGIELGFMGKLSPFLFFLICPLIHIGMMVFMFKGKKNENSPEEKDSVA